MLQNSFFVKYLPDLDERIELRVNGKSLNSKPKIDPSLNLKSIKKLGYHDVRSPLTSSSTVEVIGSINKKLDQIEEALPFIKPVGYQNKAEGETEQIKIIFDGELSNKVSLYNLIYPIRKFKFYQKILAVRKSYVLSVEKKSFLAECPVKKGDDVPLCVSL